MEYIEDVISIDEPMAEFYNHLSYNDRVILSAKFGDGKTYFLNKFKETYSNDYTFITIYPVNYQTEENKDIFELIKHDILFQLCQNQMISDKIDIDTIVKETFNKENITDLADFLTNLVGIAIPGACLINDLAKRFLDTKKKYNKNKKTINQLFSKFNNTPGIYENDCYTKLITSAIQNYKLNNKAKKVVLIIEDLDRMDPAHVFRILNIFSAHIDRQFHTLQNDDSNCQNKFCFDKIITVCHYQNLNSIFSHIYGKDADFEGYIAKFTTQCPFKYSIDDISKLFLLKKIGEICNLSSHFLSDTKIILDAISKLSIRRRIKILDNIDKQIIDGQFIIFEKYKISTKCSATRFLVILRRLNINTPDNLSLILYKNPNETIKLVDKLWGKFATSQKETTLSIFKPNHDDYVKFKFYPQIVNDNIESINIYGIIDGYHKRDRTDNIEILFNELLKYII